MELLRQPSPIQRWCSGVTRYMPYPVLDSRRWEVSLGSRNICLACSMRLLGSTAAIWLVQNQVALMQHQEQLGLQSGSSGHLLHHPLLGLIHLFPPPPKHPPPLLNANATLPTPLPPGANVTSSRGRTAQASLPALLTQWVSESAFMTPSAGPAAAVPPVPIHRTEL